MLTLTRIEKLFPGLPKISKDFVRYPMTYLTFFKFLISFLRSLKISSDSY